MKRMHSMSSIAAAVALACAAPLALAQTTPPTQSQHPQTGAMTHTPPYQTPRPQDQSRQAMPPSMPQAARQSTQQSGTNMGQHDVTGTVKTIGANGIVDVRTTKGVLRVQFPDAVKHLKKGEKITLHLSYSVSDSTAPTT